MSAGTAQRLLTTLRSKEQLLLLGLEPLTQACTRQSQEAAPQHCSPRTLRSQRQLRGRAQP